MTSRFAHHRRHAARVAAVRRAQQGVAARGAVVAAGIAAALALQVGGSRLQCRLADLVGAQVAAPVASPASAPSCGSPSGATPMHACKVATLASAGMAPATI